MVSREHKNSDLSVILSHLDFGNSVAENDTLLENARVETSAFQDLFTDRADLIPGTKGSGKSALYRMFIEFLPDHLLRSRKVVVAHGVRATGSELFHEFRDEFASMTEDQFVDFWCIYLVSLAHQHFVGSPRFARYLDGHRDIVDEFKRACREARIPDVVPQKKFRDVLEAILLAVRNLRPAFTVSQPDGSSVDIHPLGLPKTHTPTQTSGPLLPRYVHDIQAKLSAILDATDLALWLLIDRLDEVFPRRTDEETRALRGLLRAMRIFSTPRIRVKVFIRDDMLEQVTEGGSGFTALTHVADRSADTLRWSEDQILSLVVRRIAAKTEVARYVRIDARRLERELNYQREVFYRVFPATVHSGPKQSNTLHWIYTHTMDGLGVVTPRDVILLLARARQHQLDLCTQDPAGVSTHLIGPKAIQYGLAELSKAKRDTYLRAEFPHFWDAINRLRGGKTEYTASAIRRQLGVRDDELIDDLCGIGVLQKLVRRSETTYKVPFLYKDGLELTQGRAG